jgi:D-alanyl-D-alanine-carboxypeptidase/D-alanyl-D-alanine-endopeptidase
MRFAPLAILAVAACGSSAPPAPTPPAPGGAHADEVAAQVKPYMDAEIASGLVVAVIQGDKVETYGFGRVRAGEAAAPGADTRFEAGAVTQVLTALLAADAIERGEVALDTPLAQLLPFGVQVPGKDGATIVLGHLVTHTSGLPTLPPSLAPRDGDEDPFGDYRPGALLDDLGRTQLEIAPGRGFVFSSFGYALLGEALARKAGLPWSALVAERLLGPLGMKGTLAVVDGVDPGLAPGHDSDLRPMPAWNPGAMGPAVAVHTTARDLAALVVANLGAKAGKDPLAKLLARGQEVVVEGTGATRAFAWFVDEKGRRWHNGATGGHHAFVAFDPAKGVGVVVLAATASSLVDRLGESLLTMMGGEPVPPVRFPDAAALAGLAGTYDLQGTPVTVTTKGVRLYAQSPGDAPSRLVPLSDTEFLIEEAEAVLVFELEGGKAARLAVLLGTEKVVAERTADPAVPAAPATP